jgi:hypothetical protein
MPVAAAVGDLFEVRLVGKMEGQETDNVFHFACVGASSDVELYLIVVMVNCFIDNLLPVLSSAWSFEKVVWKKVSPTLGVENVYTTDLPAAGGGSAAALPSYASAVISKRTAQGGRSHRGRFYIAGIPEDATTNSTINPGGAFWTALASFITCVITNFVHPDPAGGTNLFDLGVYSRKIGGSTFPLGASGFTAVTQLVRVAELGTTRSRKLGRGA